MPELSRESPRLVWGLLARCFLPTPRGSLAPGSSASVSGTRLQFSIVVCVVFLYHWDSERAAKLSAFWVLRLLLYLKRWAELCVKGFVWGLFHFHMFFLFYSCFLHSSICTHTCTDTHSSKHTCVCPALHRRDHSTNTFFARRLSFPCPCFLSPLTPSPPP